MNLTWIEDGRLAAMGQPWPEDMPRLRDMGITHVIALTERLTAELDADDVIAALHLPVRDFTPPSQDQLVQAVLFIEAAHAAGGVVAVHCGAGLGRTGTVCAAWLVSRGQDHREAIANVRRKRRGSVETRGQEGAIAAFAITWRGRSDRGRGLVIRVGVNGACGRMGQVAAAAVHDAHDVELVLETDLGDDLGAAITGARADVVIDFTVASSALTNLEAILGAGACAVVGTSGFGADEVAAARELCRRFGRPALVAPNFSVASVLLARFAAQAAEHLPDVELIEAHHTGKEDAPSGTALKVAADIAVARRATPDAPTAELVPGVRGGVVDGVRIHALRVPGLLARMECLFGGVGDTLTLRHDTLTRESFMPGVLLAVRRVQRLDGLVYGLEHLL